MTTQKISIETKEFYNDIKNGTGWASEDYIQNFSPLSEIENYHLMLQLAEEGILLNEMEMTDANEDLENISDEGRYAYSVEEVIEAYGQFLTTF